MKIKICGMRDSKNIEAVEALAPDFMGFIFYDKSPRWVGRDFKLPPNLSPQTKKTGVFVNAAFDEIMIEVKNYNLDFVQLHGDESIELCAELKEQKVAVIKVFSVDRNFDFEKTRAYEPVVDYFLFDTKGNNFGGNGVAFDWGLLKKYDLRIPYFLSGGLSLINIKQAQEMNLPGMIGLDFNSGVEISPGMKDLDKVRRVIETFKYWNIGRSKH